MDKFLVGFLIRRGSPMMKPISKRKRKRKLPLQFPVDKPSMVLRNQALIEKPEFVRVYRNPQGDVKQGLNARGYMKLLALRVEAERVERERKKSVARKMLFKMLGRHPNTLWKDGAFKQACIENDRNEY